MQNKSRKNNKKFLVIIAMILMIGLVSGMGAMTYSKYISTTNTGEQKATAAKWGYVVTADADELFGERYTGTGLSVVNNSATSGITIRTAADAKVVAPGSKGSMTINVSGGSEVLAKLSISVTGTEIKYEDYYPIVWTLKNGDTTVGTYKKFSDLDAALAGEAITATWNAGTNLFELSSLVFTLSWEWAYNDTTTDAGREASAKDTLIGYKATGTTTWDKIENLKCATGVLYSAFSSSAQYNSIVTAMTLTVEATVEQIQA